METQIEIIDLGPSDEEIIAELKKAYRKEAIRKLAKKALVWGAVGTITYYASREMTTKLTES